MPLPTMTPDLRRSRGFTLIELLVVLAILALLAGLVGPRVLNQLGGAKSKTAGVQVAEIEKALELFKLDVGRFPTTEEGLAALTAKPAAVNESEDTDNDGELTFNAAAVSGGGEPKYKTGAPPPPVDSGR